MTGVIARFRDSLGAFDLDVDFQTPASGVTGLFGPSGCGKTTVLRCIAGLAKAREGFLSVAGEIWQDGERHHPSHRRAVGYVFQEASLFPHLSVRANLMYGQRRAHGRANGVGFDEAVAMLRLERLLDRAPGGLSGGERQRVAIGRAILAAPRLLLMDEPLAALDRESKDDILGHLEALRPRLSVPVIYVSHAVGEVERLADHLVVLNGGRVTASGIMEDLVSDLSLPFARRSRAGVVLNARVADFDARYHLTALEVAGGTLWVAGAFGSSGTEQRLRILAVDVSLTLRPPEGSSILNILPARVETTAPLDAAQINVLLRLGEDGEGVRLLSRITRRSWETLNLTVGSRVFAQIKSAAIANRTKPG